MRRSTLGECGSVRRSTLEECGSRRSRIDSILENGCISRCSVDEETGALRLYVRRNTRDSSSSSSSATSSKCIKNKRACRTSMLHLAYRKPPNLSKKKPPCSKTKPPCTATRTQIVKEQIVQTEITISADVDMWETREYCRCDLRDGRSESPERCPTPPPPPPPKEITTEPYYDTVPPPKERVQPPREKTPPPKRKRRKRRRNSKLAFRNYNIAFQKITLNSELPDEIRQLQNYYVTQDSQYKLKFEKSGCSLRNDWRQMKDITLCKSEDKKEYEHRLRERRMKRNNGLRTTEQDTTRDHLKTPRSEERSGFMLNDDRLYTAWNAFCGSFLRYLAHEETRRDDFEKPDAKEAKKSHKNKEGKKFHKEKEEKKSLQKNRKRKEVEGKEIKKQPENRIGPTIKKKRGAGDNVHRLGFAN